MEYFKQLVNLKDKKIIAAVVGTLILFIALPLTVIGTLYFKEGTQHLKTKAAAPALDQLGFPRISWLNNADMLYLKFNVLSVAWSGRERMKALRERYPLVVGLRYFAGRAYQTDERSYPWDKIYAGHWLFLGGTTLTSAIGATTETITVGNGTKLAEDDYAMIWDGTAGNPPAVNQDDPNFWKNAEHVLITGVTENTVTITRNCHHNTVKDKIECGGVGVDHPIGSRMAQHIRGAGTEADVWAYNVSTKAPVAHFPEPDPYNRNGKQFNQILGEWLATHLNCNDATDPTDCPDTKLEAGEKIGEGVFNGYLFDTTNYWINGANDGRVDCDNDNNINDPEGKEGCVFEHDSSWGRGFEVVFNYARNGNAQEDIPGLGPDIIIAGGVIETRGFDYLNGNQFEGFPGNFDMNQMDADFARYESWLEKAAYTPRYLEMYSRFQTLAHRNAKCDTVPPAPECRPNPYPGTNKGFRYTLGMVMLGDGFYEYNNGSDTPGDYWWDEFAVDLEAGGVGQYAANTACTNATCWKLVKDKTNYLGQPTGDKKYQRLFSPSASDKIFEDLFENGISSNWTKTKAEPLELGEPHSGNNSLKITPTDSGAVVTLSPITVEANKEYTLKFWAKAAAIHDITVEIPDCVVTRDDGRDLSDLLLFPTWKEYYITFTPKLATTTASIRFKSLVETSEIFLDDVQIFKGGANIFRRDFENGIVLVNGNSTRETFDLEKPYKRINGTQDRGYDFEGYHYTVNDGSVAEKGPLTLGSNDAIILLADVTSPTVSITSPTGGTVKDTVEIATTASDPKVSVGITKVEFYVDDVLKSSDASSPYSYNWDTTTVSNGSHSLLAKAYDAANNVGESSVVRVDVDNRGTPQPPSVDIKADGFDGPIMIIYNTSANLTWSATNTQGDTPCTASNGWLGSRTATGSESTGRLLANKTFTITCNGLGGRTASDSVTVNVGKIGDLNGNGVVDFHDFSTLVSRWGTNDPIADLNLNGFVDFHDFSTLVSHWGS